MYCTRCGTKIEDDARFCTACGQSTAAAMHSPGVSYAAAAPALPSYAGFWVRAAAYSIDSLILDVPFYFLVLLAILSGRSRRFAPFAAPGFTDPMPYSFSGVFQRLLFLALIFLIVHWLYFAGMESSARQATFGKAAMSLRVTDARGTRLSFAHASGRFFAKIVTSIIPLGIGYILAGVTAKKQALHDFIAGTIVLRK